VIRGMWRSSGGPQPLGSHVAAHPTWCDLDLGMDGDGRPGSPEKGVHSTTSLALSEVVLEGSLALEDGTHVNFE